MKKLLIIATIIVGLISCGNDNRQQTTVNSHSHQHSESCSHNHDHNHNHDHSTHSHEHSATCNHDHDHNHDHTTHKHDHSAHSSQSTAHSHDHGDDAITFSVEQQNKIDFEVVEAVSEPLYQIIRTSAQILPSQENEKILTATTSGIVSFENKDIIPGMDVKSGQTLFSIDNDNMADGSLAVRRQEIEAEYQKAKAEYERKQSLAEDKIISQSELLDAKTEYLKAEKHYQNMIQNYPEGKTLHRATISGSIKNILVPNNSYVEAGQPIMVIAKNDRLYVRAHLQSKYYNVLKDIKTANIKTSDGTVYSLSDLSGCLLSYGKTTDVSNPLIPITFEIKNNGILLPGSFVEIFITVESDKMGIMLPNTAIVEEMGIYCVFVQTCTDSFEKRIITKGVTDGNNTQILKGIEAGERVVSKGAVNVKLAQGSAALDPHAGHVH